MFEEPQLGFLLTIQAEQTEGLPKFPVESINRGLPEEVVLAVVRNWLRKAEDDFYKKTLGSE